MKLPLNIEWGGDALKKWIVKTADGDVLFSIYACKNSRDILGLRDTNKTYKKLITVEDREDMFRGTI